MMRGVSVAYYLLHSMDAGAATSNSSTDGRRAIAPSPRERRECVKSSISAASGQGGRLSPHLASRHDVGQILRRCGIATIELPASIVIDAGSASFETVRAVVKRLPAIPPPRGVDTAAQPIAMEDLIEYLVDGSDESSLRELTLPA
jgi:uncharacterized protein YbjT (DUF2867 family)